MNMKIGVVIGVIVLLLLGGGAYLIMKKSASPSNSNTTNTATSTTNTTSQGSLKSLFESGKPEKCTFDNKANGSAQVNGVVYVASGKVRGDFQGNVSGTTINSHMIIDSQTSYVWTDLSKQGFKFAMTDQGQATTSGKAQAPDLNQTVNYSCQDWTVDNSVFTLPTDVTFTAFSIPSPVPAGATGSGTGMSQCAICDGIPAGAGRDACKAQYYCK